MAASQRVSMMMDRVEEQHRLFLNEVVQGAVQSLKEENCRLSEMLDQNLGTTYRKLDKFKTTNGMVKPPVPAVPDRLFTPPGADAPVMHVQNPWIENPWTVPGNPMDEIDEEEQKNNRFAPKEKCPPNEPHSKRYVSEEGEPAKAWPEINNGGGSPGLPAHGRKSGRGRSTTPVEGRSTTPEGRSTTPIKSRRSNYQRTSLRASGVSNRDSAWEVVTKPKFKGKSSEKDSSRHKEVRRLRDMLGLSSNTSTLTAELLTEVLYQRQQECKLTPQSIQDLFQELSKLQVKLLPSLPVHSEDLTFTLSTFVRLLFHPELLVNVQQELICDMEVLVQAVERKTVDEIIEEATRGPVEQVQAAVADGARWWDTPVSAFVMSIVFFNLLCMGVSMDWEPSHWGWLVVEGICALVFIFEILLKLVTAGWREFVSGDDRSWNWLDIGITGLSLFEVTVSLIVELQKQNNEEEGTAAAINVTFLRVLRAARVMRLVKLLRFRFMRELGSMLVGIVIGMPALFWVFILFMVVLFVTGTCFRAILGPTEHQNLLAECGTPDRFPTEGMNDDATYCKIHYMYGEEFFGSVKDSMFTTFRFMIGDFSSQSGKSLAVAFSQGYGDLFHICYGIGMVSVMFGFFNVITAIFVDSTISGLKHTDLKKNHSRKHERRFLKEKLKALLHQIVILRSAGEAGSEGCQQEKKRDDSDAGVGFSIWRTSTMTKKEAQKVTVNMSDLETLQLDEEEFFEVISDGTVKRILEDLDISILNPTNMYETFDPEGSGKISVSDFVQAVTNLRGEPQKNDLIATWQKLCVLQQKVEELGGNLETWQASAMSIFGNGPSRESHRESGSGRLPP